MAIARKRHRNGLITYRGPLCPYCASVLSRTKDTGYTDEPDQHRIRHRRCIDCQRTYLTVEVPVTDTTFYRLDGTHREMRRKAEALRYGYTGVRMDNRVKSDVLKIKISVEKPDGRS